MTDAPEISEEDDARMGEYVLRLLPPEEAQAFEARILQEPALQALHAEWQDALSPLVAGRNVLPPAHLKSAIEARVFAPPRPKPKRWAVWLQWSAVPAALAVLAFLIFAPGTPEPGPTLRAEIAAADGALRLEAVAEGDALLLTRVAGEARPGRALQLWAIADGAAPVSLGLLSGQTETRVALPEGLAVAGLVLAVSDEPPGGSPTGQPTGEVLATGPLSAL